MMEISSVGVVRIYYKSNNYQTGVSVTGMMYKPDNTVDVIVFIEKSEGLYYNDYNFSSEGEYALITKEDGVKTSSHGYSVRDTNAKLDRILGLVHENTCIDQTVFDGYGNLISARVRLYSNPSSVGTDNDVIYTYNITAVSTNPGQFSEWRQVKI